MNAAEFSYLSDLVRERSAIVLDEGKEYLVSARLEPLMRREGIDGFPALVKDLRAGRNGKLVEDVIEAMTTNETSFFRDIKPFETLAKDVLPALVEARSSSRRLNIWCAASSSGQEPYTIAMVLREFQSSLAGWTISFVSSDISRSMLERSEAGIYSQLEVNRGLPIQMLVKYFKQDGKAWRVKDELREMVRFESTNLAGPWPPMQTLDLVFMRNVLIYFDVDTKREIFRKTRERLAPDGYLFLGSAETTINIDDAFQRAPIANTGCYTLK